MPRLLITNGVQQGRAFRLRPGVNRIGRGVENHFQIPDSSVSGAHCEITLSDAGLMVLDLNSTNGTFVNGEAISKSSLALGQVLQLGSIQMQLDDASTVQEGPSVSVPDVRVSSTVTSTVLSDGSLACANHPELAAAYQCTKCQQTLCESCVRIIHRMGGESMAFCSLCDGACESVLPASPPTPAPQPHKPSLLSRLTDTLRLPFKR